MMGKSAILIAIIGVAVILSVAGCSSKEVTSIDTSVVSYSDFDGKSQDTATFFEVLPSSSALSSGKIKGTLPVDQVPAKIIACNGDLIFSIDSIERNSNRDSNDFYDKVIKGTVTRQGSVRSAKFRARFVDEDGKLIGRGGNSVVSEDSTSYAMITGTGDKKPAYVQISIIYDKL